ncbi:YhgE/Pip family protein [Agromyces subbeticus]|uniref:YhgE/Pip family protein n=1 Tax=Agromyces subbeticus TaxID=293890 RepID=UPI0003B60AC2|nr:YhgE/Pip domain-containing protein [Agromyces subbeticus]
MFAFLSSGTELRRFRKGVLPKIALVVLLFIPLIYGALYLWAFWAPTDELKNLPVALVNDDAGASRDGTSITAGDDLVDELTSGGQLDWHVTDAADATAGVTDGDYYFAVTIPSDFSASAVSVGTDAPKAATVEVDYNDSNSFLASTLGKQAMVQLRDAVAEQVGQQTADAMLVGINEAGDGIRAAADGAGTLADGVATANAGAGTLVVGLGDLASGASSLDAGASRLADGTGTLAGGLDQLASGAGTLSSGATRVADGAAELSGKMNDAAAGSATLAEKAHGLADGATAIAAKTGDLAAGTQQLSGSLEALAAQMQANPELPASSFLPALQAISAGAGELNSGAQSALPTVQGYAGLSGQYAGAIDQLSSGLSAGAPKAAELATGAAQVRDGASTLAGKSGEAASGAHTIASGAATLSAGTGDLVSGAGQLSDGGAQLASGATQLADGSRELADKLDEGAASAPQLSTADIEARAEVMASPVQLDQSWQHESKSFGEGFAPFFIALATFVGALITWLILRALPTRALAASATGLRAVMTGFLPAMAIGLGQVVIMVLVLVYGIGLEPVHWLATSAFIYLVTLAFLALQQMFIIVLGTAAGRVVSLVLLMLQLSSSGGTYPVETTPQFFQALHPFMPASYVVSGLRELITGGVDSRLWLSVLVLAGILVGSLAISAWSAGKQRMWSVGRLHPELAI